MAKEAPEIDVDWSNPMDWQGVLFHEGMMTYRVPAGQDRTCKVMDPVVVMNRGMFDIMCGFIEFAMQKCDIRPSHIDKAKAVMVRSWQPEDGDGVRFGSDAVNAASFRPLSEEVKYNETGH